MGLVHVGMKARVKVDAFDYQKYGWVEGRVAFVSPDSEAEEGAGAVGYVARIERTRDHVGRGEMQGQLKWGMTGLADIVTGEEQLLGLAFRKLKDKIAIRD